MFTDLKNWKYRCTLFYKRLLILLSQFAHLHDHKFVSENEKHKKIISQFSVDHRLVETENVFYNNFNIFDSLPYLVD